MNVMEDTVYDDTKMLRVFIEYSSMWYIHTSGLKVNFGDPLLLFNSSFLFSFSFFLLTVLKKLLISYLMDKSGW